VKTSIRWLGHSTVLLQHNDTRILTDPVLRRRVAHLWRRVPLPETDWPGRVDAILISHLHWDHLDLPTLRRLGNDQLVFVPRGARDWLVRRGFGRVRELGVGDREQIGDFVISAVPADHSGRRPPFGPTADAVGYMLGGAQRIYFPGDTDLFDGMTELGFDLDVALMPIWGWGSTLGAGHLDPIRAAEATRRLHPQIVIPIHWGTFHPIGMGRGGAHFLEEPPIRFASAVHLAAPEVTVRILAPGETLVL